MAQLKSTNITGTLTVNGGGVSLSSDLDNYLPLNGGTMTGELVVQGNITGKMLRSSNNENYVDFITLNGTNFGVQGSNGVVYDLSDIKNKSDNSISKSEALVLKTRYVAIDYVDDVQQTGWYKIYEHTFSSNWNNISEVFFYNGRHINNGMASVFFERQDQLEDGLKYSIFLSGIDKEKNNIKWYWNNTTKVVSIYVYMNDYASISFFSTSRTLSDASICNSSHTKTYVGASVPAEVGTELNIDFVSYQKDLSSYIAKSGATDVTKMSFKGDQYNRYGNYAMNLNNSDIIGANLFFFGDPLNLSEGFVFPRDNGNYDLLRVYNGEMLLYTNLSAVQDDILAANTPYKVVCENKEINGNIQFAGTADNSSSYGLNWYGSTDSAHIYYDVAGADEGRLIFEMKDDNNTQVIIRHNNQGSVKDTIFENGEIYTAGDIILANGACISGETRDTGDKRVYHSIELGYPNKDYIDFNEYGGVFNFNKTNNVTKEKIAHIDGNGIYHNNNKLATENYVNDKIPTFSFSNGVLTITT